MAEASGTRVVDVLFQDGERARMIRALVLVEQDDDFMVFRFRDGHTITVGKKFIIKLEESTGNGGEWHGQR